MALLTRAIRFYFYFYFCFFIAFCCATACAFAIFCCASTRIFSSLLSNPALPCTKIITPAITPQTAFPIRIIIVIIPSLSEISVSLEFTNGKTIDPTIRSTTLKISNPTCAHAPFLFPKYQSCAPTLPKIIPSTPATSTDFVDCILTPLLSR